MSDYNSYQTERLTLTPVQEKDAAFIFELLNTPKWFKFIGDRNVKTVEEAREYISSRMLPQLEKYGYGNFAVIRKEDQQMVGTVGLYHRPGYEGVDLGYAFLPAFEGQGYAIESARKLMEVAFSELKMTYINAYTNKENLASQKLLKKLDFVETGVTKFPGEDKEILKFSRRKS